MPKNREVSVDTPVKEKIEYLGLNFERVPKALIASDKPNFKTIKTDDERQYKQYKFLKISDIDILLTPKHRMDSLRERYEEASPLYMYLDSKREENASKYNTFLSMLKKVELSEVEKIEDEQKKLAKKIPYRVKFNGNYLWQIYYSEKDNQYFMLVPTEDSDYSTFFYLLKKKIENTRNEMVFVPVSYIDYSGKLLKKTEIKDLENYLWLFTKDYPSIYEVYNEQGKVSLQIIGETSVYGKIKSLYKMSFDSSKDANKFFKLLKALFILQVEMPHYYNFKTKINQEGGIELYLGDKHIQYNTLVEFIANQYSKATTLKQDTDEELEKLKDKLSILRQESTKLEQEYLEKEKMISTFLECKKSFFGKVKYYFKFGKKSKKSVVKDKNNTNNEKIVEEKSKKKKALIEDRNYTLDELIIAFKELETVENKKKNVVQDINALKLKNKNLKRKIENATMYINEINEHKKSIFEFWKYSNKDEVAALEEGEEEIDSSPRIEKTFDFNSDFETFGESADKSQRMKFTDSELDSSYLASTNLLEVMNDIYIKKTLELKDYSKILNNFKEEKNSFLEQQNEEFDIFGNDSRDNNKEKNLGNKIHRESHRDIYEILGIKKDMKASEFKKELVDVVKNIKRAIKKNSLEEDIYVYRALLEETQFEGLQLFSLDEENELKECLSKANKQDEVIIYRLKLPKGTNFIALSNIIFYNNKNMTLPVGMQESKEILIDMNAIKIQETQNKQVEVEYIQNDKNDFSKPIIKTIEIVEIQ